MSEHYDFHYQPTGSGAISGQQVLQQTEDAINELGDYVNDNVGGAMDVAQQALETAQNAEQDAQTALDTANSFSSAIQSAQQDASTALSTAQTAQTTASNANNTAIQAQQDASSAVTTANNASGQVSTLSGTVTTLGQRVTTAEGNIGQNTSDISGLTTRMGTAEGNITTLQNDVTIAQGNASSAMATAGQVKQQAFVFRYSSTALVASSTNSNALLDNTDNLKVGDKVIDSSGVLFSITAIDTVNSTFTVGSALVDLALDANVMHLSGDESASGNKNFMGLITTIPEATMWTATTNTTADITLLGSSALHIEYKASGKLTDLSGGAWSVVELGEGCFFFRTNNGTDIRYKHFPTNLVNRIYVVNGANRHINDLIPDQDNTRDVGSNSLRWATFNGLSPSSLGMPDLDNGIDISSYITVVGNANKESLYTPPANGWISVALTRTGGANMAVMLKQGSFASSGHNIAQENGTTSCNAMLPVKGGVQVSINSALADGIDFAYFYPCQGNV